jgi:hypothetical protein
MVASAVSRLQSAAFRVDTSGTSSANAVGRAATRRCSSSMSSGVDAVRLTTTSVRCRDI